ncbi:MarR family winged helix-turn-helix transcriptional regulator [Psychromonas sp. KJ10-10]|uniref:MarR family winged helix-turn-helix transcriptional regulator n=1 Tax=Psychromonas sp. KJ10-10 TaxID=3391823 RepID=UPI0039B69E30
MSDNNNNYNMSESIPMLMSSCVKYMRETLNSRFIHNGYAITSEQWMLLMCLGKQDGVTQQELAKCSDISKVSVLNLIKKLEKNNLIIRHPDPVDGRSNRVYLTDEGRNIQCELIPFAKQNTKQIMAGISEEELQQVRSTIKKMLNNLNR